MGRWTPWTLTTECIFSHCQDKLGGTQCVACNTVRIVFMDEGLLGLGPSTQPLALARVACWLKTPDHPASDLLKPTTAWNRGLRRTGGDCAARLRVASHSRAFLFLPDPSFPVLECSHVSPAAREPTDEADGSVHRESGVSHPMQPF